MTLGEVGEGVEQRAPSIDNCLTTLRSASELQKTGKFSYSWFQKQKQRQNSHTNCLFPHEAQGNPLGELEEVGKGKGLGLGVMLVVAASA